jgi:predicted Zn finger-like uncharacterized protein
MTCPKCNSKNIHDHSEFGLPLGFNMRCGNCGHMWIKDFNESIKADK